MESDQGLPYLPSLILTDILSRLPIKTIFRCKSVCKTWLKLLSEPEFVRLHLARSPVQLLIQMVYPMHRRSGCFNLVEVEDESDHHDLHYFAQKKMEVPIVGKYYYMTMVGSINGLVCLNEYLDEAIHIWNPTTRECITIRKPESVRAYPNIHSYGFGFSSVNGKFNVVSIFQEIGKNYSPKLVCKSECHIYTLGTGSWRNIGHAPFQYYHHENNIQEHGIFLNDNLHWLIYDQEGSEFISCLNLETELFEAFPSPPELIKDNVATLNAYGGCLWVCDNTSDFDIVIWIMKDYGIKNSWSKEAVISKYPIDLVGNYYEVVHVIKVFKDGEILLLWNNDRLLSYHLERKTLVTFDAGDLVGMSRESIQGLVGIHPCIEATDYVPSFLSLRCFEMEKVKMI